MVLGISSLIGVWAALHLYHQTSASGLPIRNATSVDLIPPSFTALGPLELDKIGASRCDEILEEECPKWKLHCKVEKWVLVNITAYTGNDSDVQPSTFFAHPSECRKFLNNGQLSVTQYLRHYISLAYAGLWTWTDPDVIKTLRKDVGREFFETLGSLDMDGLNSWVSYSSRFNVTIKVFDYATECRLRKLLQREWEWGKDGERARDQLMRFRGFYGGWKGLLFDDYVDEEEEAKKLEEDPKTLAKVKSSATRSTTKAYWIILSSLLCLGLYIMPK